ncbi:MAG: acyl--CoA ligase [Thermoplasmata archaeon]|nr:acyl--CoA ligase [Thermoplasmata archaeon]
MSTGDKQKRFMQRLKSGEIADQACWSFIKEMNSVSDERLDSVAITDSYRQYTYRQMFWYWERYAEAFSGIGLTGENHSRVGLISVPLPETIFTLYALNMTGASISVIYHLDLYDEKQIYSMIEREKITDLVISEIFAFPNLMKRLHRDRGRLGIKKIIVIPSPMGGDFAIPAFDLARRLNAEMYRELPGSILMEDLLEKYEAYPISYAKEVQPIILHTTGTVSGMHKPVPLTNKAMNSFVVSVLEAKESFEDFKNIPEHIVTYIPYYINWAYCMVDALHTALSLGAEVVSLPMASMNPRYSEAIERYGVNVLMTSMAFFDTWHKTKPDIDLSKLKILIMGGTYVSPEYKKEFNDYLRSCGSTARVINGYGLSELGGACTICPSTRDDDAIGYLLPGIKAKIFVEDENRYYEVSDGPRTGLLLLGGPTMSSGVLDGTEFFELEEVDGEKYFNSHDLVKVAEDGCLTCIGRSNHYFVNNAGVRFDAGLVENAVTKQPGVRFCGLTPEFHKILHDNVPILYVEMRDQGADELGTLRNALIQVFIKDELISDTNLPSQCVIVKSMPLNTNGKVDAKKLKSGTVTGARYSIRPVHIDGKLVDILLVPAAEGEFATMGAGVPEELEGDPYNIVSELFSAIPEIKDQGLMRVLKIPGLRELMLKLTDFDIDNIPASMWNLAPKLFNMTYKNDLMPLIKQYSQLEGILPMLNGNMPPMPPMMPFMPMPNLGSAGMPGMQGFDANVGNWMEQINTVIVNFWKQLFEMQRFFFGASMGQFPAMPGFPAFPFFPNATVQAEPRKEEATAEKAADAEPAKPAAKKAPAKKRTAAAKKAPAEKVSKAKAEPIEDAADSGPETVRIRSREDRGSSFNRGGPAGRSAGLPASLFVPSSRECGDGFAVLQSDC